MRSSAWKTMAGFLILFIITPSAEADKLFRADISAGGGILSGYTQYTVGGKIKLPQGNYYAHFPVSKLDFPIRAYLLSLQAGITFADRLTCSVSWGKDLTDDPDRMKDYDWQLSPGELSIYSESNLDLEAQIYSGVIQYRLFRIALDRYASFFHPGDSGRLRIGAGYLYRQLDFAASDTWQTYPDGSGEDDFVSGRTLTYSIEYQIPFIEMGMLLETKKITAEMAIGYSPYTEASDKDRHLLRDLTSEADCEGEAVIFSLHGKYLFFKNWHAGLRLSLLEINTEGISRSYLNGDWNYTIDTKIESRQFLATLEVGLEF